jgi:Caspase domain
VKPEMSDRFEHGHACIIGIGGDLPTTVGDAQGLAKILKDPERCAYPENQVHLLTGEQATRANIIAALETLADTTNAESTVLIYFSGHGHQLIQPVKSYYLMPHGYNTKDLAETAISGGEFTDLLRDIPAQKLLVMLDCCHAGGLSDLSGFQIAKAPLPPEAQRMFAKGGGRMMIGSSRPDELSYAGEPYSAFTYALVKGLCGSGAVQQDGYIRATDLAMYASSIVPTLTDNKQHPVLDIEKADNFILAYYAGGQLQPKGLPSELEQPPKIESKPGELNGQTIHTTNIVASGDRAVAVQNASGATIITGDGNTVGNNNVVQRVTQKGKYNVNLGRAENLHIGDVIHNDEE